MTELEEERARVMYLIEALSAEAESIRRISRAEDRAKAAAEFAAVIQLIADVCMKQVRHRG